MHRMWGNAGCVWYESSPPSELKLAAIDGEVEVGGSFPFSFSPSFLFSLGEWTCMWYWRFVGESTHMPTWGGFSEGCIEMLDQLSRGRIDSVSRPQKAMLQPQRSLLPRLPTVCAYFPRLCLPRRINATSENIAPAADIFHPTFSSRD
jgi:hypothetical protein